MPKFSVVKFTDSNDVAVVATRWLSIKEEETLCYCPPVEQFSHAAEKCIPVHPSWKAYECELLYCSGDYSKARLKLRDAGLTSDLESEARGKNFERRKRKWYASNSEDEPEFLAAVGSESVTKRFVPSASFAPSSPQPELSTSPSVSLPSISDASGTNSLSASTVECLLTKLDEINESLGEFKKMQAILNEKINSLMLVSGLGLNEELPEDIQLPLTSTKDLITLEKKLENSTLRHTMILKFGRIGGTSVKEATQRILKHTMTNVCAQAINWKGRGSKLAFAETRLRTVITKAVRQNPHTSKATDYDVEKHMKEWMKFAKQRDDRRKESGSSATQMTDC